MKFKTPPVNAKIIATLPAFAAISLAALAIYRLDWAPLAIPLVLGIIAGGLADLDNGLSGRLKNIFFTLLAFAVSTLAVQLTLHDTPLFVFTITFLAFLFTLIGAVGLRYRTIAFATVAVSVYTTLTYRPDSLWYTNPAMILLGALLYSCMTLLIHLVFPHRPVQEAVANAYDALGGYLDAKACFFDPDEVAQLEQKQIALAMKNNRIIETFNQCRSALFYRMRGQHRHPRTSRMLRYYFAAQDIHERASSSHIRYQETAEKLKNTDLLFRCLRLMELQGEACRRLAHSLREGRQYVYDERLARAEKGLLQSLEHYAATHSGMSEVGLLRILAANLQGVNSQLAHLDSGWENEESGDWRIAHHESSGLKEAFKSLRQHMTLQSATFRHAVRMAVLTLVCCLVVEAFNVQFGYWILLTAVFVCQPNYSATQSRLKQRVTGTLAGVLVGSLLPHFMPSLATQLAVLILSVTLFFFFRANKYSYSTFFITLQALASFAIAGNDITATLPLRMLDTVIGCALSWVAVSYLWPDWNYLQLSQTGAQAVSGNAAYLRSILQQLQSGGSDDVDYRLARRQSHESAALLSSTLSDMSLEPEKYGSRLQDGFKLLKINYSLIGHISALGAYRSRMLRSEDTADFLQACFTLAEEACRLMEQIGSSSRSSFEQDCARLQEHSSKLPDAQDESGRLLRQQLGLIIRLLLPAYHALHGEPDTPPAEATTAQTDTAPPPSAAEQQ